MTQEVRISIKKENLKWLNTTAKQFKETPKEIIERLVNQKLEEHMKGL
jgi:hypothetical protein